MSIATQPVSAPLGEDGYIHGSDIIAAVKAVAERRGIYVELPRLVMGEEAVRIGFVQDDDPNAGVTVLAGVTDHCLDEAIFPGKSYCTVVVTNHDWPDRPRESRIAVIPAIGQPNRSDRAIIAAVMLFAAQLGDELEKMTKLLP